MPSAEKEQKALNNIFNNVMMRCERSRGIASRQRRTLRTPFTCSIRIRDVIIEGTTYHTH